MHEPSAPSAPEAVFSRISERYLAQPDITAGTGFGSTAGLRVRGRIFAMLMDRSLVVKLPADRVHALITVGGGAPFGARKGRPMREWVAVSWSDRGDWDRLAEEAFAFVAGASSEDRRAP